MPQPRAGVSGVLCALALFTAACATRVAPASMPVAATPPQPAAVVQAATAPEPQPRPDPVVALLAESSRLFDRGEQELQAGHLGTAKSAFNRALEVLLESPSGARTEPRLREQFDRLVERISAFEVTALAQGDGFAEQTSVPASIDELLTIATTDQPAVTPETEHTVAHDLASTMHDIEIPLNERVLSFVELLTGRLRSYLQDGLSRGARFLPMIQDVFRAEGLPLDLAYVPLIESAFKPNALSRASAKGIWQFMRGTGLENGLRHDWYIDERADPEKATRAAAKYLKTLYGMFGDWHLALASYNAGPGRVQKALKRAGEVDFWAVSSSLPRETQDYVPLILAAVIVARNPVQYGLDIQPTTRPAWETVTLPHPMDLRTVAEWAGTPVQTLQDLNPELRRWTTPIRASDYELKVPRETADLVRARLADIGPDDFATLSRHTVHRGETLRTIARKLRVPVVDLAEANYLSTSARLKAGQQLVIPRAPALLLSARADSTTTPASARQADVVPASRTVASRAEPVIRQPRMHRVTRGETLSSIARRYDTTIDALKRSNSLRGNTIHAGQQLTLSTSAGRTVAASRVVVQKAEQAAPTRSVHRVKPGETLYSIARLYDTTVDTLKRWNSLRGSAIRTGQRLTVFTAFGRTVASN